MEQVDGGNMTEEIKITKCPFCGNDSRDELGICNADRYIINGLVQNIYNVCCSCGATGPDGESREEAAERWNKRAEGA
jgi:hypothetical protein